MPKRTPRNILVIIGMKADELPELLQARRIQLMIIAICPRGWRTKTQNATFMLLDRRS